MTSPIIVLGDFEIRRRDLENNISSLRKALQHWQTWEAEYEGFQEEISGLGEGSSFHDLEVLGNDLGGTLLNDKEIKDLIGSAKPRQHDKEKVLSLLSRRIEYVQQNTKSISKRLATLEEELLAANVVSQAEVQADERHPLTEIWEELDENDNVVSSSTTIPGDLAPEVLEVLRKAGVRDFSESGKEKSGPGKIKSQSNPTELASSDDGIKVNEGVFVDPNLKDRHPQELERSHSNNSNASQETQKKRVTFAEDTKEPDHTFQSTKQKSKPKVEIYTKETIMLNHLTEKTRLGELVPTKSDDPDASNDPPIIPIDETPEDAELRRQMLQYNLNEVGAIVAEIEIDDDGSYTSYSEDEDGNHHYDSSADEDEDEHGRTTRRVIDDEYRKEMQQLEGKLNISMIENIGRGPVSLPRHTSEDIRHVDIDPTHQPKVEESKSEKKKKGVRFAQDLDIASPPRPNIGNSTLDTIDDHPAPVISEDVIERSTPSETVSLTTTAKKPSRFKAARTGTGSISQSERKNSRLANPSKDSISSLLKDSRKPVLDTPSDLSTPKPDPQSSSYLNQPVDKPHNRQTPEGPPVRTHANILVERPPTSSPSDALEPDELNPTLLHQEVSMEYYRMRNQHIQRNGGFMQTDEPEQIPAPQDGNDSVGRKVSRFKAARLARLSG